MPVLGNHGCKRCRLWRRRELARDDLIDNAATRPPSGDWCGRLLYWDYLTNKELCRYIKLSALLRDEVTAKLALIALVGRHDPTRAYFLSVDLFPPEPNPPPLPAFIQSLIA